MTKTSGRQAEREGRGDAERVVDRGADVAVSGREERGRAEHALELNFSPAVAAGHGGEAYNDEGPASAGPSSRSAGQLAISCRFG